ncbi:MAG TPA: endonuclease/exonuclease/phosphatase family protein [Bdellovibrionales bacterium]|nr:MAG: hypothetical protein A2Z97_05430 [Bdellovibrionales bacterium GWB1_52_6]OFZ05711.1 MAG: hypothetical protein A2X97_03335 [Bdellovibrionales bacterium GWA1_52_35]OFZ40660.1 MAG: hypothetical protein A2070_06340 [Bdellovibrionales bacterium GWC1_52_8]HAR44465.1 endonuclease/exonuclease/phosphatase family protein [Bdellovibrionales bacterium]HCM40351.1 endonuclease/exonuclease/phosphatase family protein [Bdellovibrionales bacterium]
MKNISWPFFLAAFVLSTLSLNAFSTDVLAQPPCYFDCGEIPPSNRVLYHVGQAKQTKLKPDEIRMLVWNIYKGGKSGFNSVFADLNKFIRPDIIVLEEAALTDKILPALQSLGDFGWELGANFLLKSGIPTGPVIGSAVQATQVRFHRTEETEPVVNTPKTTVIVEFPLEGSDETLLVAGIHGINFTNDLVFEKQLTEIAKHFQVHRGPVVFAGDFNIWNRTRLEMAMRIAEANGLLRAPWEEDGVDPIHYQLDDAYTRGVTMETAQVWSEGVKDVGSDHPALFLKFSITR